MEFAAVIFIAVVELILNALWNPFYFRTGIPIFWKEQRLGEKSIDSLSADQVEGRFEKQPLPAYAFKALSPDEIAFRVNFKQPRSISRYTPIMRGLIRVDRINNSLKMVGYLYYFPLVFIIGLVSWRDVDLLTILFASLFVLAALISIYYFERKRFMDIFNFATE